MSSQTERDLILQLAEQDPIRARDRSRAIPDPLSRAQALAWLARFSADTDVMDLARESLAACSAALEPYHRVAAAAWPIRALIERGLSHSAEQAMNDVIARSKLIENPASRVDALFLLWQAVYPLGTDARKRVMAPLLEAAVNADSWKPQRILQSLIFMLPADERALADAVIERMPVGKYKRGAARRLAAGEHQEPRRFFWRPVK